MKIFRRIAVMMMVVGLLVACGDGGSAESKSMNSSVERSGGAADYPVMGVAELDDYLAANSGRVTMAMLWTTW